MQALGKMLVFHFREPRFVQEESHKPFRFDMFAHPDLLKFMPPLTAAKRLSVSLTPRCAIANRPSTLLADPRKIGPFSTNPNRSSELCRPSRQRDGFARRAARDEPMKFGCHQRRR